MAEMIIILICLSMNAVLASIEMALVTVRKPELRILSRKGHHKATRILAIRDNPERALSVIQVGITMVGAISAAVGGAGAEETLAPFYESRFGLTEDIAEVLAIASIVLPLTYLSVVLGELFPKTIALRYPMKVLNFGLFWLEVGDRVLGPVVSLLELSTKALLWFLPGKVTHKESESAAHVDLDGIPQYHRQYIVNLANIETKRVQDILLPWNEVGWVELNTEFDQLLEKIIQSGHTRTPVLDQNKIAGILNSKEFLAFAASGNRDWHSVLRPAVIVTPQTPILGVLRQLQEQRRHMAIVIDHENILGLVTLEDIFEEVIGELHDEDDDGLVRKILSQRNHRTSRPTTLG